MAKLFQSNNALIINLIMFLMLAGAWLMSDYVVEQFNVLPVREIPKGKDQSKPVDVTNLYQVLVEFKKKPEEVAKTDDAGIDLVFKDAAPAPKEKELVVQAVAPINYEKVIRANITVDAIGANGAFINDYFFKLNEIVIPAANAISAVDSDIKIKPILYKVSRDHIDLKFGKKIFSFKLGI